jgi:hypothetical protein
MKKENLFLFLLTTRHELWPARLGIHPRTRKIKKKTNALGNKLTK